MDWDKVHKEDKERTQGVEWAGRRKRYRPWVTESSIEQDEGESLDLEDPLASESPEMKALREEAMKRQLEKVLEDAHPKWKSPFEGE